MAEPDRSTAAPMQNVDPQQIRVGRQAIFDRNQEVYAYELLFRGDPVLASDRDSGDSVTSRTILDAFIEIGIDRLTGGKPAFLNLTRRFFVDLPPLPFEPGSVVLEILEDIPVDQALIDGVSALRKAGYRLAIDDYLFEPRWEPLLPLVEIVKVEIGPHPLAEISKRIAPLRDLGLTLLAEKVETPAQYRELHACGFDLFQGFFFARPDVVEAKHVGEFEPVVTQLLSQVHDPEADIGQLSQLISQDPGLSYKLLRLINSAAIGLRREVDSIQQAVVLLGLERIRAWATLFLLAGRGDRPNELFNLGLMRANLCERLSRESGIGRPDTAYTVGLLSVLNGMLSMPMSEVLAQLPLPTPVCQAISALEGEYGQLLQQAIALDQDLDLPRDALHIDNERLISLYLESSDAAFAALATLSA